MARLASRCLLGGCAGAGLAIAAPASAQAWIGQVVGNMMAQQAAAAAEAACMGGGAMTASEVDEARAPANALMHAYFVGMAGGGAKRSSFFALDRQTRFTAAGKTADQTAIDAPAEPVAGRGLVLDAAPLTFFRSGMDATAVGEWAVRDAAGAAAGVYTGFFVRKLGEWKLRTLRFDEPAEYDGPVVQYCHAPGDVLPCRLASGERMVAWNEKRLAKAEAKAASAAANAEAAGGKKLSAEALEAARAQADKWASEVAERRAALDTARTALAAAKADEAAVAASKASARSALGFS